MGSQATGRPADDAAPGVEAGALGLESEPVEFSLGQFASGFDDAAGFGEVEQGAQIGGHLNVHIWRVHCDPGRLDPLLHDVECHCHHVGQIKVAW